MSIETGDFSLKFILKIVYIHSDKHEITTASR